MRKLQMVMLAAAVALALPTAASATILTFDIDNTNAGNIAMDQAYGDRVTALVQSNASYGVGAEGFTPNVVASYGPLGASLTRWSTEFGDLVNVFENEDDGDTSLTLTLTADAGNQVSLFGFDMGGYSHTDYTIPGLKVVDGTGAVLFSATNFLVQGAPDGTEHSTLTFGTPLAGNSLSILVDLTGLGGNSDNIGIDNVRFGQGLAGAVPEPAAWATMLLGLGLARCAARYRRRAVATA